MKRLIWISLTFVCFVSLTCLGLALFFQTDYAKSKARYALTQLVDSQTPYTLDIGDISTLTPFEVVCDHVTLKKSGETVLEIDQLSVNWLLRSIFTDTLTFSSVQISNLKAVEVAPPLSKPLHSPSILPILAEKKSPFPFAILIKHFEVRDAVYESFEIPLSSGSIHFNTPEKKVIGHVNSLLTQPNKTNVIASYELDLELDSLDVKATLESQGNHYNSLSFIGAKTELSTFIAHLKEPQSTPPPVLDAAFSMQISPLSTPSIQIEGRIEVNENKEVSLSEFLLKSEMGLLKGKGACTFDGVLKDVDFDVELTDSSLLVPQVQGKGWGHLTLQGPLSSPEYRLDFHSVQCRHPFLSAEDIDVEIYGKLCGLDLELNFLLNGFSAGIPLHFDSKGSINLETFTLEASELEASIGENTVSGSLNYSHHNLLAGSHLKGHIENFPQVAHFFQITPVKGAFDFEIDHADNTLWIDLKGYQCAHDTLTFDLFKLNASIPISRSGARVTVEFTDGNYNSVVLPKGFITLKENGERLWDVTLHIPQQSDSLFYGALNGRVEAFDNDIYLSKIHQCDVVYDSIPIALVSGLELHWKNESFYSSPCEWKVGEGSFSLEANSSYNDLFVKAAIKEIPAKLLLPPDFQHLIEKGSLSGTINTIYDGTTWKGANKLHLHTLSLKNTDWNPVLDELKASVETSFSPEGNIYFTLHLNEKDVGIVTLDGFLPLNSKHSPYTTTLAMDRDFSFTSKGILHLSPFIEILSQFNDVGKGDLDFELNATGSLNTPQVEGFLNVKNGHYESFFTGTKVDSFHASITCSKNVITLHKLYAKDSLGGSFVTKGVMDLLPEKYFPYEIEGTLNNFSLFNRDDIQARFDGPITFVGNTKQALLFGELETKKALFRLPEHTSKQLPKANITYISSKNSKNSTHDQTRLINRWLPDVDLSLTVHSNGSTLLEGKGLKSRWKGQITFSNNAKTIQQHGMLSLVDGSFNFAGKKFIMNAGEVAFDGSNKNDINLNLTASLDIDDVSIETSFKGPLTSPKLQFSSTPQLDKSEILSLVLFNSRTSNLQSPLQALQFSQNIAEISGSPFPAPNLFGKIKERFKLDKFEFTPLITQSDMDNEEEDSLNMGFQIGKYITKNLLISITKGLDTETGEISIEADLLKKIKAKAAVDNEADASIQLQWQYDY